MLLPLLLIFPLIAVEMTLWLQVSLFVFACLFIWAVQFLRLRYLGFTWKQCIAGFFLGALGNTWWQMWRKDPVRI